jgi:hypothetical protein
VRLATILALMACAPAAAQVIVNPARLRTTVAIFDPTPGEATLRCEVTPIRPTLNFSFRFQAGYRVMVPASLVQGKGHRWTVLTSITPQAENAKPVYLASIQNLPEIPKTSTQLGFSGGFLLGEGVYDVNWVLIDDQQRVCRKTWRADVHRSRSESNVRVAMPAQTVWDFSLRGARRLPSSPDDAARIRLTVLLNAAPLFARRTRLGGTDIGLLISALSSLLERVPVASTRVIVFSLDLQKELYRKQDFLLRNMPDVAQAMYGVELNTVDFQVLKNRQGHLELLADLVNQELAAPDPSDVILFLGPVSRFEDGFPAKLLEKPPDAHAPQFWDFQLMPFLRGPAPSALPDVIRNATGRLGGKTIRIHSPGEFAKAIAMVEKK